MSNRKKIYKVLTILTWTLIVVGVVIGLVSAIQKEQKGICKEVIVKIDQSNGYKMIDETEIFSALWPESDGSFPIGISTSSFDLFNLEKQVEKNPWVQSANLYFDQMQQMHISILQKMAVARVFNPEGNSYYLDSIHTLLPVKNNDFISLPVFTNFYFNPIKKSREDSNTISRVVSLAKFIAADSFWMAQVESVNINFDNTFELVTQVGNQRVMLGMRDDWNHLFKKLSALYLNMTENEHWDKYNHIDLQFMNQVICSKKEIEPSQMEAMIEADTIESSAIIVNAMNVPANKENSKITIKQSDKK